jgi:2-dehydropantoate 2-reductase
MQIVIIGAGALGGVVGFHLAAQADVTLVDPWVEHVAVINRDGLRCEIDGVEQVRRVRAVSDPAAAGPAAVALVLVKAQQTPWAAGAAQTLLALDGVAYTLQNGLGNAETLAAVLGAERVGQGVTSVGATLLGPGRVRCAGLGPTTLGAQPNPTLAAELAAACAAAGLPASVSADLDGLVWGKLLVNVAINALTALLRVPNGALASIAPAREVLTAAVAEAAAVAAARGISLPYADPVARALEVVEATATNRSSMLQDVLRGAATEIATINGAIVREGARLGVPTPVNWSLTRLVEAVEQAERAA